MIDPDRFEEMRRLLETRVKPSRYLHSMGVSQTAEQLARIYGANENDAAVAGLLHDWDKALSYKELKRLAKKHKLAPKAVRKQMPGVLHSLTAPYSLHEEFPELSPEVLQAVGRHTCGATDMTDLDKIVFIADIIEPGRTFGDVAPLREAVGAVSLDELFFMTYGSTLVYLIEAGLPVHPDSLDVWNVLVAERAERLEEEAGRCDSPASPDALRPRGPRVIVIE
ncbi:phosphohydrolase [Slackia faecicanis]|uniref:bis(5'-nucleosyl)-tetraphosphatase (symmetrical) n=1 Tax=Slackia faecicanis TaxID=255723 RepID=A0A3N0AGW1_9ACTN|nr:bis(5'-nucleosyl)-tetraphosphatase (symmetrical) YqeK [Slackia faecicanis]RNL21334.1 phosphohydrolase [Slackia faecicanis]